MKRGSFLFLALSVTSTLFVSGHARAFEREWHTGGGIGITAYPHYYSTGPAFGANAGYGLSDVFDLKLELLASSHNYIPASRTISQGRVPLSLAAGLSYKLDVLQWIPYAALLVGYQHTAGAAPWTEPFRRDDALAAVVLGLDYAVTRNFGLGASVRADLLLTSPDQGEAVTTMLRAEYHWGF
jgi:hypothetical protein